MYEWGCEDAFLFSFLLYSLFPSSPLYHVLRVLFYSLLPVGNWERCVWRCVWWRIGSCRPSTTSRSSTSWSSRSSHPLRSASLPHLWGWGSAGSLLSPLSPSLSPPLQVEDSSALTMLEEVTTVESRQDVAMTLVKIYLGQGLVVPFLDYLNTREVNHTSEITGSVELLQ